MGELLPYKRVHTANSNGFLEIVYSPKPIFVKVMNRPELLDPNFKRTSSSTESELVDFIIEPEIVKAVETKRPLI
jgi:hypothetical protein